MMTKTCSVCKAELPISEFRAVKDRRSGYRPECKACGAKIAARSRSKKLETYRAKEKQRGAKRWKNPEARKRHRALKDPRKEAARNALRYAVWSGEILKPAHCEYCGQMKPLHGHHKDYRNPLDVDWLCASCHHAEHRKAG